MPLRRLAFALSLLPALAAADPPRISARVRLAAAGMLPHEGDLLDLSVRADGGTQLLVSNGFSATPGGGSTVYVRLPRAELARLAALPGVHSIEPVMRLVPSLDKSVAATFAPPARADFGLDGSGTLIGVVDTGCDFRHADLRDAAGHTRLAALLDARAPRLGSHPGLPDYNGAALWLRDEIDAQLDADASGQSPPTLVTERDVDGHGTHVLGITGSSGLATANGLPAGRYTGMAPGALLAMAQASRDGHGFTESDVLASTRFLLDRATALGLPAVVNLSLSGDAGPHDGTTNFERGLADLIPPNAPGRALVIAAGNAGARDLHAGGHRLDTPADLSIATSSGDFGVDLWSTTPFTEIAVVSPKGHLYGPVASGKRDDPSGTTDGNVILDVDSAGADPINGRYEAHVELHNPIPGNWHVFLTGPVARWDAWLTNITPSTTTRFLDHLDPDARAQTPAFAASAISVGSFVSRTEWVNRAGMTITRSTIAGAPSSFSATGPTLDGRFLPDLTAPGEFIASAMSRDAPPENDSSVFFFDRTGNYLAADDGLHGLLRGTSQAAPHVAGAISLLFQMDPTLSPDRLRELLRASADVDPGAPGFSPKGGFGHLNVLRAARLLRRDPAGAVDPTTSTVGVSRDAVPPGSPPIRVSVVPRDATGTPLGPGYTVGIDAYDPTTSLSAAFEGDTRDLGEGRYERTLLAQGPRGAALTILATVDGVPLSARPTVWLVPDRAEIGHPFHPTGGCSLGPPAPGPPAPLPLLFGFLLLAALLRLRSRHHIHK